ncbi:hypothetical protein STEG23_001595 [Scotinomys teguina]
MSDDTSLAPPAPSQGPITPRKGPPKFKQRQTRQFKSKPPKKGVKGFGDDIPGMEGLGTEQEAESPQGLGTDYKTSVFDLNDLFPAVKIYFLQTIPQPSKTAPPAEGHTSTHHNTSLILRDGMVASMVFEYFLASFILKHGGDRIQDLCC